MKFAPSTATLAALAVALPHAASQTVSGEAEGFASGVTGGGDATPDYPQTIEELASLLTDDVARVIVLDREFDFTESEGQESGNVCASWGTDSSCQKIIQDDCGDSPALTGTWWVAPRSPIDVGSNKSILGVGAAGAIKGKGLRFRDGASNVIVQNIAVTDLNPEYVWGGDAISFDGSDQIWIDHVTHYVFGFNPSSRVTLSNNFIDGESPYSTGCSGGMHYWTFELVGEDDQITMKGNYISRTSGRSPALSGNTLLHAVNNVWQDNDGHAIEGGEATARGIFEGNAFVGVNQLVSDYQGRLFTAPDGAAAQCEQALGRACEANAIEDSGGDFDYSDTSFFGDFSGLTIASAVGADEARSQVPQNAGVGKI